MSDENGDKRPESKEPKKPGLVGRAGRGLGRLIGTFIFGVVLLFGGFFVLVWGEQRVNIGAAIAGAENLNDGDVSDGVAMTYTGDLDWDSAADEPLLSGEFGFVSRTVETCAYVQEKGKKAESVVRKKWVAEVPDLPKNAKGKYASSQEKGSGFSVGGKPLSEVTEFYGAEIITPEKSQVEGAMDTDATWVYFGPNKRCEDPHTSVGDQRISFRVLKKKVRVTAFGKKDGDSIVPFRGQALVSRGGREELVSHQEERTSTIWMFRAGGGVLLWIALFLVISPILKLVTWIPLFGGLVKGAATVFTLVVAAVATLGFVFMGWGMGFFTSLFGGLLG